MHMHMPAKHEAYQKEQAAKPAGGSGPSGPGRAGPGHTGGRKRDASEPPLNPVEKKRTKFETYASPTRACAHLPHWLGVGSGSGSGLAGARTITCH